MLVPVLFILGDENATVTAIIENALGLFISWTVQIMIFGPKLLRILTGTANILPSMDAIKPGTTAQTPGHVESGSISKSKVAPSS